MKKLLKKFIWWILFAIWIGGVFATNYIRTSFYKVWTPVTMPATQFVSGWSVTGTYASWYTITWGTILFQMGQSGKNYSFLPLVDSWWVAYLTSWAIWPQGNTGAIWATGAVGATWARGTTGASFTATSSTVNAFNGNAVLTYFVFPTTLAYSVWQAVIMADAVDPTQYNIWYVLSASAWLLQIQTTRTTWTWFSSNWDINLIWFDGTQWAMGATGARGTTGSVWATGANGSNWITGAIWATGANGSNWATGATGLLQAGTFTGTIPYWNGSAWITSSNALFYTTWVLTLSGNLVLSSYASAICLGTTSTGLVINSTSGSVYGLISGFVTAQSGTYFTTNIWSYLSWYISGYSVVNSFVRPWLSTVIPTTQAVVDYIDILSQSLGSIITTWAMVWSWNGTPPIACTEDNRTQFITWWNLRTQVCSGAVWVDIGWWTR